MIAQELLAVAASQGVDPILAVPGEARAGADDSTLYRRQRRPGVSGQVVAVKVGRPPTAQGIQVTVHHRQRTAFTNVSWQIGFSRPGIAGRGVFVEVVRPGARHSVQLTGPVAENGSAFARHDGQGCHGVPLIGVVLVKELPGPRSSDGRIIPAW